MAPAPFLTKTTLQLQQLRLSSLGLLTLTQFKLMRTPLSKSING
jgi:hypothetical protein